MYLQGFKYVSKAAYTEFLSSLSLYTTVTNVFTNLLSVTDICSFNSTIDFFDWECNLWCHLLRIVSCHVLPCLNFWWFYGVGGIASIQGPTLVSNIFCSDSDGSVIKQWQQRAFIQCILKVFTVKISQKIKICLQIFYERKQL